MGYKMKQDESPAKNLDFLTTSGTGGGYINPAQQSSAAGAAGGGFNTGGAGAIAGGVGMLTNTFGEQDPLKQGYGATKALGGAAQGAQMGAALGPYGMAAGALIGGTVAVINADKEKEKAKEQKILQDQTVGASKAQNQLLENKYGQGRDLESKSFLTKKGEIKMKPMKKLGAITGTMSPNMSMAQYKDEKKFSAIAKNMVAEGSAEGLAGAYSRSFKPINHIKTNKNFATPGTGFKDNSGTNNQPKTITSGDRAKEALKKALKTSGAGGAVSAFTRY
mgnify:CR=1 FL=1